MANEVSKAEYLKRYLESDSKSKRKHKKKTKSNVSRLKIVDQDISIKSLSFGEKSDEDEDEAPVVAEVIDERPEELRLQELYDSSRWKKIDNRESSQDSFPEGMKNYGSQIKDKRDPETLKPSHLLHKKRHNSDSDISPPRETKHNATRKRHDSNSDISPPRKVKHEKRRHDSGSDISPPRKTDRKKTNSDSDLSPDRISKTEKLVSNDNSSFIRTSKKRTNISDSDSDFSPPRSSNGNYRKPRKIGSSKTSNRKDSDSDISLPRGSKSISMLHPKYSRDDTVSQKKISKSKKIQSRHDSDSDISPQRTSSDRPHQTLSGLKAGLQNASALRIETKDLREREKTHIKELDDEISGRNAETIVRDRKTGKKRDLSAERKIEDEKNKRTEEHQKKYMEWGKGIEQTQNRQEKFAEDLYEMSKPLARYKDDEDLDRRLKETILEEDPMYEYMKKKQKKNVPTMPTYSGPPPPPNRFGIMPGYRWDGVDRSNGFEKRYFEKHNQAKATEEEAYLWSVQNM